MLAEELRKHFHRGGGWGGSGQLPFRYSRNVHFKYCQGISSFNHIHLQFVLCLQFIWNKHHYKVDLSTIYTIEELRGDSLRISSYVPPRYFDNINRFQHWTHCE